MPSWGDDGSDLVSYVGGMNHFIDGLRLDRSYSRWLGWTALLLTASGIAHTGVVIARGWDWSGAVSFRKPVTFAISFALLLWACGWVMDRLPSRPPIGWGLTVLLAAGSLGETGLITMQSWRGVASHFNVAAGFDAAVFAGMGATIVVVSIALGLLAVWALIERPPDSAVRLAILAGMAMILAGLGIGMWVIQLGFQMLETLGAVPDTVLAGEAGVAKFPHALALHGLQLFIVTAVVAARAGFGAKQRHRIVGMVVAGYASLLAWSVVHTNAGRAPLDLAGVEMGLAAGGGGLLAAGTIILMVGLLRRPPASTGTLPA